jgi:hypothetical protein
MADEAQIRSSIFIRKVDSAGLTVLQYTSQPTAFNVTVTGTKGPVPGAFTVSTHGIDVDFGELATPGLCIIKNFDSSNWLEYGIWDPEGAVFYPLGEVGPGEIYALKLARNLQEGIGTADPGTGTTEANTNRLRLRANAQAVEASVEAFEV